MLKHGSEVINKSGLHYIAEEGGKLLTFKPWLGDAFSFLYDFMMKNSIFPKRFGSDIHQHYEILRKELKNIHEKRVAAPGAIFICSVPVPERNRLQSTIRGTLYSEKELEVICQENGFIFESIPAENGALLYFRATLQ
jgi:hypothetical protein